MEFRGRIAVITGGGSGIGKAVAKGCAVNGGHPVILDIDEKSGLTTVAEIKQVGGQATFLRCDLSDFRATDELIDEVASRFGRIDILLNNGFAAWKGPDAHAFVAEISDDHWHHVLGVALESPFRVTRKVLPIMQRQGGGAIVNTASTAALRAEPHITAYSVAKAGLAQFTRMVATEYAREGIRCNAVCPGVIDTPLIQGAPLDEAFISHIPMGRLGKAEEVANVALFLASDLASYVTGELVVVDGGRTL